MNLEKTGVVPPREIRIINGVKYRAGDTYPLPAKPAKSVKKMKPTTEGGTDASEESK